MGSSSSIVRTARGERGNINDEFDAGEEACSHSENVADLKKSSAFSSDLGCAFDTETKSIAREVSRLGMISGA